MTEYKINSDERFVRWQSVLREHLSFINNLVLTFSVGTIGFILALLNQENFNPTCCQKIFLTSGLLMCFLSLALGFATSFSRLHDFRATVKKIKNSLQNNTDENESLKKLLDLYKKTTWGLFYGQIIIFCLSILSLTIAFLIIYKDKLF